MKFISGAKRAAKFTMVDMPLSILGWRQLKANHGFISDLWHTLRNPRCPECSRGVMHLPADAQSDDKALYGWECSAKCGFGVFAPNDQTEIRRIVEARIAERGKQRLAFLGYPERNKLISSHLWKSRAYWAVVLLAFLMAAWLLAMRAPMVVVLSVLSLTLAASSNAHAVCPRRIQPLCARHAMDSEGAVMTSILRTVLQRLSRERITAICCALGTCLALWVERDVLINGRPADQLGTIALAIVVPILYLTPLVWLVYRYLVRPAHENR